VLFFDELEVVFEVGGAVGYGHEGHEGAAEEDAVDQRDDGLLGCFQPQPDGSHHDSQTNIHGKSNTVHEHVTVTLDKASVQQRQDHAWHTRLLLCSLHGYCSVTVPSDFVNGSRQVTGSRRRCPGLVQLIQLVRGGVAVL
jgi:hypothetical protein